jgi:hypothetical protein
MSDSSVEISAILQGCELSSVVFVRDYLQLDFDGPRLSALVWPVIRISSRVIRYGEASYRDALCGLIGQGVVRFEEKSDQRLTLVFANGSSLEISLRDEDRVCVEAALFHDKIGDLWVW